MQREEVGLDPTQSQSGAESEGAEAAPKGINLKPLVRAIQRQMLLIAGITGALSIVMWKVGANAPKTYAGSFQMLVEPVSSEAKLVEPTALARSGNTGDFALDYPTQILILKSPEMLSGIVEQVKQRYPKFGMGALNKGLIVERIGKGRFDSTKIINITYQGLNPEIVEFVLKKTADKYLKYSLEERKTNISEGVKFIEEQLPDLQSRVGTYQAQLQQLQQQYEIVDPITRGEQLYGQIQQIEETLNVTDRELNELKNLYTNLQSQLGLSPKEALTALALSENPHRTQLLDQLKQIEAQIAQDSAIFKPDSPEIQLLQEQKQNITRLLGQETGQILSAVSPEGSSARVFAFQSSLNQSQIQKLIETANQIQVLSVRRNAIEQTRQAVEQQVRQFPAVARQYGEIQQQLDLTNQTLNQLLTQREKLRVEAAQNNVPWQIVSPPQVPRDLEGQAVPLPGDSTKKLMLGVIGGLVLGVGAALILEKWRGIFFTPEDLEDSIPVPLLGVIPPYAAPDRRWFKAASTPNTAPFLEAFDTLYANLRFAYAHSPIRTLAVCSAQAGDGKSMVALHLACTAAQMGQRVLLVDANFRHPQQPEALGGNTAPGLSELLRQKLMPNSLVSPSELAENLFVLGAGEVDERAMKLLGSAQMEHIASEFRATFDLVIYDTAPLDNFMDAVFVCAHVDGILGVVGMGQTQQSEVRKTFEQLQAFRLGCIGVVANSPKPSAATLAPELAALPPAAADEASAWEASPRSLHPEVELHE